MSFPTTKEGRNSYFMTVVAYIIANQARLLISDENKDALSALYGDSTTLGTYVYLYLLYANKGSSRTDDVIADLNNIEQKIIELLMKIYDDIPASVWTNADRSAFGRKTGLPHIPTKPESKIEATCILDIIGKANGLFAISGREHEDSKRSSLPEGSDAMELAFTFLESPVRKLTPDETGGKVKKECFGPDDDTIREVFYKAKGELQVDANLAGFNIVIWGRWINTKYPKLAGNWSIRYTLMIAMA